MQQPLRFLAVKGAMELTCPTLASAFTARTSIPVVCDYMDINLISQQVGA